MKATIELLKARSIFASFPDEQILSLAGIATKVELDASQVLFYKGDKSRDMYVLASGKLLATTAANSTTKGEVIGQIMPGDPVGEMSLLTGAARSLTVLAAEKSTLLMIDYEQFQQRFQNDTQFIFKMLQVVASRSQGIIKQLDKSKQAPFILLLPASNNVNMQMLLAQMRSVLATRAETVVLNQVDVEAAADSALLEQLEQLKNKSDLIIYPLNLLNPGAKIALLLQHANKIVLIAEGGATVELDDTAAAILNNNYIDSADKPANAKLNYELVLLYAQGNVRPYNVADWLDKADFFRYHHVYLDKRDDVARLMRFMHGSAVGVVFGGGGLMRGWAHIGVIKYLLEAKIPIDAVGGTSIGAIVGASFLLEENLDLCIEHYAKTCASLASSLNLRSLVVPIVSIFSGNQATLTAQQRFPGLVENFLKPYFCISCNITQRKEVIHSHGLLWQALRASSSLPGLVPPLVLNHELHVDGAVTNNLPVNVMRDFMENSGKVIAVSLSNNLPSKINYFFPPYVSLWESIRIKLGFKNDYRFPSFINTFLAALLMGSDVQQKQNMLKADVLITPEVHQYSTLSRQGSAEEMINRGYQSAKQAFEEKGFSAW